MTEKPLDLSEWEKWDERSKKKFLEQLNREEQPFHAWYCKVGRTCDGKPHKDYDYKHARGDQWPPLGDWTTWLLRGGRGSGKTRSGAEWLRYKSQRIARTSMIGPTRAHIRQYMVEGISGLQNVFANVRQTILWEPSKLQITLANGHIIQGFSGEEPDRLRGPEHGAVWLDEPAHMPEIMQVWDMMNLGLRYGMKPQVCCTTTPLPIKWLIDLLEEEDTVSTVVNTYANIDNLAPPFARTILKKYEGTRLGRQEIYGEILEDVEGALWQWDIINENRVEKITLEDFDRIVVGIDPSGTSSKKRDETGIIVVGKIGDHYYVIADRSGHYTPDGWAKAAWKAFDDFKADKIVAEKNYGGEMVVSTLRNNRRDGSVELVWSRRGKVLRAEPVVGLYEQGRVHHNGYLPELEGQQTTWVPGPNSDSPDRVDALVHGVTALNTGHEASHIAMPKEEDMRAGTLLRPGWGYQPRESGLVVPRG